jgi:hypothetical protein
MREGEEDGCAHHLRLEAALGILLCFFNLNFLCAQAIAKDCAFFGVAPMPLAPARTHTGERPRRSRGTLLVEARRKQLTDRFCAPSCDRYACGCCTAHPFYHRSAPRLLLPRDPGGRGMGGIMGTESSGEPSTFLGYHAAKGGQGWGSSARIPLNTTRERRSLPHAGVAKSGQRRWIQGPVS